MLIALRKWPSIWLVHPIKPIKKDLKQSAYWFPEKKTVCTVWKSWAEKEMAKQWRLSDA